MQNLQTPYHILLSFDLEEFDIPNKYGALLPVEKQLSVTQNGNTRLLPLLKQLQIPATFFTTAFYARQNDTETKEIATTHEIASHAFHHSRFSEDDILHSRQVLAKITGQKISGFRMPGLVPVRKKIIAQAEYLYEASLSPAWLPGSHNNYSQPRTLFKQDRLWILPASVTPMLRIPLSWMAFKNLPLSFIKHCSLQVLKKDHYLSLYFHPWEFADLSAYKAMPLYTRSISGQQLLDKLAAYLQWLQTLGNFTTMESFVKTRQQELLLQKS